MTRPEGFIPANFTLTDAARRAMPGVLTEAEKRFKEPIEAVSISWGRFFLNDGSRSEEIVVGFYGRSNMTEILRQAVQRVDGVDIVFFALPKDAGKFEGKQIDYSNDRLFFLKDGAGKDSG